MKREKDGTLKHLKLLLSSIPFRSFAIELSSGSTLHVAEQFRAAVSPEMQMLNVFTTDGEVHLINISQIVKLKVGTISTH